MKSRWVTHQGKPIFIADFSGYADDAAGVRAECNAIKEVLKKMPEHSVLAISYVEGTYANEDILRVLTELVPVTNRYVKRRAVVGVSGFRRHFLYAFAKVVGDVNFTVYENLEEALDWLAKE